MPNAENVEQHKFEKGQSGNPAGRPKGSKNVSTVLRDMLDKIAPDEIIAAKFVKEFCKGKKRVTVADATAARIINEALVKGESWAMRELIDRTEGKATQPLEHSGKDGGAIQTEHRIIVEIVDGPSGTDSTNTN